MFGEILQNIVDRTEGCLGALIMGTDGIAVEKVWQPEATEANLDVAIAEYASLLRNAKRTNKEMGFGKIQEFTLTSESGVFILRFVGDDYFVAVVLSDRGNFGRARYELRRAEFLLEKELVI
ncbi:MAG: roadblock/LC7 domain-containing protein [Pyrinomonadaceae bacterium]|nr:roadblock/LC7 domain-containing protein [Pyrinomonadaceae bacterium]